MNLHFLNLTLILRRQWLQTLAAVCQHWPHNDDGQMIGQPTLYCQPNTNVGSMLEMRPQIEIFYELLKNGWQRVG